MAASAARRVRQGRAVRKPLVFGGCSVVANGPGHEPEAWLAAARRGFLRGFPRGFPRCFR
ncbi:hypothetical protein AMP9_2558 [plant metagenome]|uniref:Uncharacterized protein n=1 Tax=plant metagenome TaxID=1297885 RepID=A0A484PX26_9ZZZZ